MLLVRSLWKALTISSTSCNFTFSVNAFDVLCLKSANYFWSSFLTKSSSATFFSASISASSDGARCGSYLWGRDLNCFICSSNRSRSTFCCEFLFSSSISARIVFKSSLRRFTSDCTCFSRFVSLDSLRFS